MTSAGTTVDVVYRQGNLVRIRSGQTFGWVSADQLKDLPPGGAAVPPPVLNLGGAEQIQVNPIANPCGGG